MSGFDFFLTGASIGNLLTPTTLTVRVIMVGLEHVAMEEIKEINVF